MTEYSEEMLPKILERRPDWSDCVQTNVADGVEYFEIIVACPTPGQPELRIESYRDELSIYWGDWHTHIPVWEGEGDDQEINTLFELLEDIFTESAVIVCKYRTDADGVRRWMGSTCAAIDDHDPPGPEHEWVMTSWLGTYSKKIDQRG